MKVVTLIVAMVCTQLAFGPAIYAASISDRVPANERKEEEEIKDKFLALFSGENRGWEFLDENRKPTSQERLLSEPKGSFYMLSPRGSDGKRFAFFLKTEIKSDSINVGMTVYNETFSQVLARRMLKTSPGNSPGENVLKLEQAINTLDKELSQSQTSFFSFFISSAYADNGGSVIIKRALYTAFVSGIVIAVLGIFHLTPFDSGIADRRMLWTGIVLLAVAAAAHFIAYGTSISD